MRYGCGLLWILAAIAHLESILISLDGERALTHHLVEPEAAADLSRAVVLDTRHGGRADDGLHFGRERVGDLLHSAPLRRTVHEEEAGRGAGE